MGKQLNFEYKNKEYTLEYTRESVKQMEREGFVANDVVEKQRKVGKNAYGV